MNKPLTITSSISDFDEIVSLIKQYKSAGMLDCVYIDYIQNITSNKISDERKLLDNVSRAFQQLALKQDVFICCASQMNNEAVKNKVGATSGSRGSGQISASSNATLRLLREVDDQGQKDDSFGILVQKCRHNATGFVQCTIQEDKGIIRELTQ
jgi:replicative DNA helicase